VLRHISVTAFTKLSSTLLGVISALVIARTLGSEGLGAFALARAIPAILALVCEVGSHNAAPFLVRRRGLSAQAVLGNLLSIAAIAVVVETVIWLALIDVMRARFFFNIAPFDFWLILLAPLATIGSTFESVLRSTSLIARANGVRFAGELSLAVILAGLFVLESPVVMVVALILARVVAVVFGAISIVRTMNLRLRLSWETKVLSSAVSYGWRAQFGNLVNILNYRLDHLIIGVLAGPGMVGVYSVATKAAEAFKFLPGSFRYVIEPLLASMKGEDAREMAGTWTMRLFLGNLLFIAIAFIIGPLLIPLVFGEWAVAATGPFKILLLGLLAAGANGAISGYNLAIGRPELNAYPMLGGLAVTVIADILFIPIWGVTGAAWASTLSYSFCCFIGGFGCLVAEVISLSTTQPSIFGSRS